MIADLIDEQKFRRLATLALNESKGDHTVVRISDLVSGTTRFADNRIVQNVQSRRQTFSVSIALGRQHGQVSTTDLSDQAIRRSMKGALEIARKSPPDPEFLPPLPSQTYPFLSKAHAETTQLTPAQRIQDAHMAISLCAEENLKAAGFVRTSTGFAGLAASSGLEAFEPRTSARFSLTAKGADSSGWVDQAHRSIHLLDITENTKIAIRKAQLSANPKEIAPGRYRVILEPAAVAGLVAPLIQMLDARDYFKGTSPLSGKLGSAIVDKRLKLQNCPDHPDLLSVGFDRDGVSAQARTLIEAGILKELNYDRFTALERDVVPSGSLDALVLSGENPNETSVEDFNPGNRPRDSCHEFLVYPFCQYGRYDLDRNDSGRHLSGGGWPDCVRAV